MTYTPLQWYIWGYVHQVLGMPAQVANLVVEHYYLDIAMSALPVDYAIRAAVDSSVTVHH